MELNKYFYSAPYNFHLNGRYFWRRPTTDAITFQKIDENVLFQLELYDILQLAIVEAERLPSKALVIIQGSTISTC